MARTLSWESLVTDPRIRALERLTLEGRQLAAAAGADAAACQRTFDLSWLDRALSRASARYTIMVIGEVSSGKSAFINSVLGRKVVESASAPTDGVISVIQAVAPGGQEHAQKVMRDGSVETCSHEEARRFLDQQTTPLAELQRCREVRFYVADPWLRNLRLVNTPGLGDRLEAFESSALEYLREEESDLIVWTFFRETAGNAAELRFFQDALATRRAAVVGLVTRCFEGQDASYDPRQDFELNGPHGVREWLETQLGTYLSEIIFYDSHVVRRSIAKLRATPALRSDPQFAERLERSGYAQLERALQSRVGNDHQQVCEARLSALLQRCVSHAANVCERLDVVEQAHVAKARVEEAEVKVWQRAEAEIIGPARTALKSDLRGLAQERAKDLVAIAGNAAWDAVTKNFQLADTLLRSLTSWTGVCNPAADQLNAHIQRAIEGAVEEADFQRRIDAAFEALIREHLLRLNTQLQALVAGVEGGAASRPFKVNSSAGAPEDVFHNAFAAAMKGVVTAILKTLTTKLEASAVQATTKTVAKKATKKAAQEAAKQATKKGAAASVAKAAGVITLVLIPFDIAKFVQDFAKGRQHLAETVRTRIRADQSTYALRLFDDMYPRADEVLNEIVAAARESMSARSSQRDVHMTAAQRTRSVRDLLRQVQAELAKPTRG